jgi:hypothetical protein
MESREVQISAVAALDGPILPIVASRSEQAGGQLPFGGEHRDGAGGPNL